MRKGINVTNGGHGGASGGTGGVGHTPPRLVLDWDWLNENHFDLVYLFNEYVPDALKAASESLTRDAVLKLGDEAMNHYTGDPGHEQDVRDQLGEFADLTGDVAGQLVDSVFRSGARWDEIFSRGFMGAQAMAPQPFIGGFDDVPAQLQGGHSGGSRPPDPPGAWKIKPGLDLDFPRPVKLLELKTWDELRQRLGTRPLTLIDELSLRASRDFGSGTKFSSTLSLKRPSSPLSTMRAKLGFDYGRFSLQGYSEWGIDGEHRSSGLSAQWNF